MSVNNIIEIFSLDGRDFVRESYRIILQREPDDHGMAYYLGCLDLGYGKISVVTQLAQSPECKSLNKINGLKKLIEGERRSKNWFWGMFGRRSRKEKLLYGGRSAFYFQNEQLALLRGEINKQVVIHGELLQQFKLYSQQVVQHQLAPPIIMKKEDEITSLDKETVLQNYTSILGHSPENEEEIKKYTKFRTRKALQDALFNSKEYQLKLELMTEHACSIYLWQKYAARVQDSEGNSCV